MRARIGSQQAPSSRFILALFVGLMIFLYRGSIANIWNQWTEGFYGQGAHGLPLLAILSFLVYRRWRTVRPPIDVKPRAGAAIALALLSLLWAIGGLGQVRIVQDLAFFFMVFPLFWIMYGYRNGSMLSWPLILIVTAFPIWDAFLTLHREITTAASVKILNGLGMSALREGFMISVPAGDFVVDKSCSGIAQFTSALAVTGVYAYLERLSLRGSVVLVLLGWLVAITGNVVRVVIIVAAGQATSMQSPLVGDHAWLGWVIFGIVITVLLWGVGRRLPQSEGTSKSLEGTTVHSATSTDPLAPKLTVLAVTLIAVVIGPVVLTVAVSSTQPTFHGASAPLPERVGPWRRSPEIEANWSPDFVGADAERQALYRDASGGELNVYVATYVEQRQGKEAVFYGNRVYDRARWRDAQKPNLHLLGSETTPRQVEETLLHGKKGGGERLVWRWYLIGERTLSGGIETKLASIAAALRGDRSARAVVISAPVTESSEATRNRLRGFAIGFSEAQKQAE